MTSAHISTDAAITTIKLELREAIWEIGPGLATKVWSYGGAIPGTPIVANRGETVRIVGVNYLPVATNIHWHGLILPNDQDGPGRVLEPGKPFEYLFKVEEAGTYWYHSHYPPVLEQVDMGLYGPFIVKSPEDEQYSGDHILMLDDWYLDATGQRLEGSAQGDMERYGNIETVNGKTGSAIQPLVFRNGELHKLRFINASTAAFHKVSIHGHSFRVTHTDGHPLVEPYLTTAITLAPGERIDAEVAAVGKAGETYTIESERSGLGIKIPLVYEAGSVTPAPSPFVPPQSRSIPGIYNKTPDFILELNSTMEMPTEAHSGMGMEHGGMHHNMSKMKAMPHRMRWTINGKSYPDAEPLQVSVGEVVKVRFLNRDTGMMHPMEHPMHIHGTSFLIVSLNGQRPDRELWKDTVNVSAGEYVDVAFSIPNPGEWMVHCHILDHEDGGLMTTISAI